eukprot:CAMPEP_0196133464 /NCGR_PEP_ID=MMETSP0910-20130528/2679_1 /TAXON_ID=49265 /ORGANISM="Thalassiosira rotula, Strain GSO102" /LENGTH=300 /DNA_ID=CAMNT_0041393193 /DNA_START=119 /DNA_END=1021 /DNA_ORIENTATION=+
MIRHRIPMGPISLFLVVAILLPLASSLAVPPINLRLSNSAAPIRAKNENIFQSRHRVAPIPRKSPNNSPHVASGSSSTSLRNDLRDEIERAAQRRAYDNRSKGGGTGETVGGAVIGGLLGGPFGALFGAQIGASFGAKSQLDKARQDEMKRKGLSTEMLDQATEIGVALQQSVEGLRATQESVDTSQKLAKVLDGREKSIYEKAKIAMSSGDEEGARTLLLERETVKEKLLKVLKSVADDRKRLAMMESNVEALETRALEIESLLRRSVGAASLQDSGGGAGFSLEPEDPLLKKFRDLGM